MWKIASQTQHSKVEDKNMIPVTYTFTKIRTAAILLQRKCQQCLDKGKYVAKTAEQPRSEVLPVKVYLRLIWR